MALIVKDNGKDFERVEPGLHLAVCSHVLDLGKQETKFGPKSKVALCFELAEKMQDGRPFMQSAIYTASLNEKAQLRQHLESWRGRKFTEDEVQGFDIEKLLNVNAMINLVEENKNGKTYTNITAIIKPPKDSPKVAPIGQPAPEWLRKMADEGRKRAEFLAQEVPPPSSENPPPHTDSDFYQDAGDESGLPF